MIFFPKKIGFLFLLFSFFSFLFSSQESILPIYDFFKDRSFELTSFGMDSFVLKISNVDDFDKELLESTIPTIVIFYSENSNKNFDFKDKLFQVAAQLQDKVKFLAVEINENVDLMLRLKEDFLNLFNEKDQVPSQSDFLEFFQYFSSAYTEEKDLVPFFLFFKNNFLIIPQNYKFETKELLVIDINKFLLAPDPVIKKNSKEKFKKRDVFEHSEIRNNTQSWWSKVKDSTSKFKTGFVNFINKLKNK